jgi:hypothetical protein
VRVRAKICPISGPGKLSVSERERKAKEIIAASGVDTKEYFDRVVTQSKATVVTFRQQVETWLAGMRNRRSKPAGSVDAFRVGVWPQELAQPQSRSSAFGSGR